MKIKQKLTELNIKLPDAPAKGGVYESVKQFGDKFLYVSGCGPNTAEKKYSGKLNQTYSIEEGRKAAGDCILNILALLDRQIGLDNIKNIVKLLVFVASDDDFYMQPQVADGATELLCGVFGPEAGCPSRSAIGVNVLPGNIPVEIEALVEIK